MHSVDPECVLIDLHPLPMTITGEDEYRTNTCKYDYISGPRPCTYSEMHLYLFSALCGVIIGKHYMEFRS